MRTIEQRDQIHASNRLELHRLILQSSSVPALHLPGPVDMYPERRTVACHPACESAIQGVDRQRIMPGANQHTALRPHHMQKRKSVMPPRREIAGKAKREGSGRSEMAARFWKRRRMEKSMLPGRNTCGRCGGFPSKGPSRYRWWMKPALRFELSPADAAFLSRHFTGKKEGSNPHPNPPPQGGRGAGDWPSPPQGGRDQHHEGGIHAL